MLFIEDSENINVPVYSIEIDGTAIPSTFKKMVDDINELDFKEGFVTKVFF